jgi:hypothetical protein
MSEVHNIQASFAGGEWSPLMEGRVDLPTYRQSMRTMENFFCLPQGPAKTRPGLRFVAETKDSSKKARLISFIYSNQQAYILEFGDLYIRFYMQQAQIELTDGSAAYEIVSPWSTADLPMLQCEQSKDVLYILCPGHVPQKLSRTGNTDWTLAAVTFNDGPYLDENGTITSTITPSATSGSISLIASDAIFQKGHIGSLWRLRYTGDSTLKKFTGDGQNSSTRTVCGKLIVDISNDTSWVGRIVLQRSVDAGSTWYDCATFSGVSKQEFVETGMDVQFRLRTVDWSAGTATGILIEIERWGVVQVTAYTSHHVVHGTVLATLGGTGATPYWREGAWSDVNGYPKAISFHDERLLFGGTSHESTNIWGSIVGDYQNFSPADDTASGPITFNITKLNNPIQWLRSGEAIAVGSLGEEVLLASRKQEPISATNPPYADLQSTFGTQLNTFPLEVGPGLIYCQSGGRKIRAFTYNLETNKFLSDDLTLLADHVTASGIKGIVYQAMPHSLLWGWLANGEMISCTYERIGSDTSKGWHRHITDGVVESMAVIPSAWGSSTGRHEVWAVVARTVLGQTRRYIEVMADNYEPATQSDYFCVDCGLTYSGALTGTVTGLDHLEGCAVEAQVDGASAGLYTVLGGEITLADGLTGRKIHVGLPYTCTLKQQRAEVGAADGTAQGRVKEIASVVLRLKNSLGGKVGVSGGRMLEIEDFVGLKRILGRAPVLFTGDTDPIPWPGDADKEGSVTIVQDKAAPMTVLAIMSDTLCHD